MDSLSRWLNSEVFIVFVVLLFLLLLVIFAVCWLMRRHQKRPTEGVIPVPGDPAEFSSCTGPKNLVLSSLTNTINITIPKDGESMFCYSFWSNSAAILQYHNVTSRGLFALLASAVMKMAEIEIIPVDAAELGNSPRFTLKIVTEQTHATELVEMLTHRGRSVEVSDHHNNPSVSSVTDDINSLDYTDAQQDI